MITRHRVLLVDEDVERSATMSAFVNELGHEARATRHGDLHAKQVRTFRPDLLIAEVCDARWLVDVFADGPPLFVAGISDRTDSAEPPFDYMLAWPLRPSTLLRLLWRVELRKISRSGLRVARERGVVR